MDRREFGKTASAVIADVNKFIGGMLTPVADQARKIAREIVAKQEKK